MSTKNRPELSEKSKYWIPRHRYYELKHFCLQYPEWKEKLEAMNYIRQRPIDEMPSGSLPNPTAKEVEFLLYYKGRIEMIDNLANHVDESLAQYILLGVTQGLTYDYMKLNLNIPCCKNTYYEKYRQFFWELDSVRG